MAPPTITCNVVDHRTGLPAVGMHVLLRCMEPRPEHSVFRAVTDSRGYIFDWPGASVPEINLLNFLFANNCCATTSWQMGFFTMEYFEPAQSHYRVADVNFKMSQGEQAPHITLFVDIQGFATWIEPLKNLHLRALTPQREYQTLSKAQNQALMDPYVDEPFPNTAGCLQLSKSLDLSPEEALQWLAEEKDQRRHTLPGHQAPPIAADIYGDMSFVADSLDSEASEDIPTAPDTIVCNAGIALAEPIFHKRQQQDNAIRRSLRQAKMAPL